jgi:hypothetical protein
MRGLQIAMSWFDEDVVELLVNASNGTFSGAAQVYERHSAPAQLAEGLRGFPETVADIREFVLGTFRPDLAGGGARLRFRCVDAVGHAIVEVEIRADPQRRGHQTAAFAMPIEAAAIDVFVEQLGSMELEQDSHATLRTTEDRVSMGRRLEGAG